MHLSCKCKESSASCKCKEPSAIDLRSADDTTRKSTLCGDRRDRGAKTRGFLRFLTCSRDPLRGSAWSRCKNSGDFCGSRRGRCAKTRGFLRLLLFELVLGSCLVVRAPAPRTGGSQVRFLPGPRAGVARCNLHKATCAEQLAQSKLHRATCTDQLAPTSLRRAPCLEQLAQSNLRRVTCTEQLAQSSLHRATCREQLARSNLHRATCREPLAGTNLHGATCAEQLAPSNLHSATCVGQLAQTNLHRPVCAEHLAWCCCALASRMLRVGKKNASCSVGPTSLAMLCFRANRGLVFLVFFGGEGLHFPVEHRVRIPVFAVCAHYDIGLCKPETLVHVERKPASNNQFEGRPVPSIIENATWATPCIVCIVAIMSYALPVREEH